MPYQCSTGVRAAELSSTFATDPGRKQLKGRIYELRTDVTLARVIPFAFGVARRRTRVSGRGRLTIDFPPTYNDQS